MTEIGGISSTSHDTSYQSYSEEDVSNYPIDLDLPIDQIPQEVKDILDLNDDGDVDDFELQIADVFAGLDGQEGLSQLELQALDTFDAQVSENTAFTQELVDDITTLATSFAPNFGNSGGASQGSGQGNIDIEGLLKGLGEILQKFLGAGAVSGRENPTGGGGSVPS